MEGGKNTEGIQQEVRKIEDRENKKQITGSNAGRNRLIRKQPKKKLSQERRKEFKKRRKSKQAGLRGSTSSARDAKVERR